MAVHQKDSHTSQSLSKAYELYELTFGNWHGSPSRSPGPQTQMDTADIVKTASNPPDERKSDARCLSYVLRKRSVLLRP